MGDRVRFFNVPLGELTEWQEVGAEGVTFTAPNRWGAWTVMDVPRSVTLRTDGDRYLGEDMTMFCYSSDHPAPTTFTALALYEAAKGNEP